MGRAPCCDKANVKKGPWAPEEDAKLKEFIEKHGTGGNWIALPQKAGLKRCGKSCRLRWLNYLRPNIKHGEFTEEEDRIICSLFASIGSRWSIIAAQLPRRTDNDIKNYWNTKLKKKILGISTSQRKTQPQQQHHQHQHQHHQQVFPSSFDATIATTRASQGSCYTPQKPLLAGLNGFSAANTDVFGTTATIVGSMLQVPPVHHYQMKDSSNSLLMFGSGQSCTSSDGSCNQISYEKEIGYEMGLETLFYGSGVDDDRKLLHGTASGGLQTERGNGLWGEASIDYAYEDIKQLIANNMGCNNSVFLGDATDGAIRGSCKTKERGVLSYN